MKKMTPREKEVYIKPWDINDSIFRARKHGPNPCDSKDFWDSVSLMRRMFERDWERLRVRRPL